MQTTRLIVGIRKVGDGRLVQLVKVCPRRIPGVVGSLRPAPTVVAGLVVLVKAVLNLRRRETGLAVVVSYSVLHREVRQRGAETEALRVVPQEIVGIKQDVRCGAVARDPDSAIVAAGVGVLE